MGAQKLPQTIEPLKIYDNSVNRFRYLKAKTMTHRQQGAMYVTNTTKIWLN